MGGGEGRLRDGLQRSVVRAILLADTTAAAAAAAAIAAAVAAPIVSNPLDVLLRVYLLLCLPSYRQRLHLSKLSPRTACQKP